MAEDKKSLKLKRRGAKARLTRHSNGLQILLNNNREVPEIQSAYSKFEQAYGDLQEAHENFTMTIDDDAEFEIEEQWMDDCQKEFLKLQIEVTDYCSQTSSGVKTPTEQVLPQLEMPPMQGGSLIPPESAILYPPPLQNPDTSPEMKSDIPAVPVDLHATVDFPCGCDIIPESTAGVYWYKSSNSDTFQTEGILITSWYAGDTYNSPGYRITDDFSIMIYNLTIQHDQNLYRCVVHPQGVADECTHDIRLGVYAKPDHSPEIEYNRRTEGYFVKCSISSIYPLAYPKFTSSAGKGISRDILYNGDGTFNTSITTLFPLDMNDTYVKCLFETTNLKTMTLTPLVEKVIINQPDNEDAVGMNMTSECDANFNGSRQQLLIVLSILLMMEVLVLLILVLSMTVGGRLFWAFANRNSLDAGEGRGNDTARRDPAVQNLNDGESDKTKNSLLSRNLSGKIFV